MSNDTICISDLILLSETLETKIEALKEMEVNDVELLVDGKAWDDTIQSYANYTPYLRQSGLKFSVHPPAWDTNLSSENKSIREATYVEYCRAIEFTYAIGGKHVVIHPGFCYSPGFDKELAKQRAYELVSLLCKTAEPLGIRLAIENVGYNGSSLFTQKEYVEFVAGLDANAAYLIDTGHAHLNGWDIPELIRATKNRLCSIHLHDNFADGDRHLPIGSGNIDWEPIFAELREVNGCLPILEYAPGTNLEQLKQSMNLVKNKLNAGIIS
ncbi:sugar phosphate isomerase/epimerase family protein [Bacillus sp. FJAT-28004]|uniref:sugar phosphate isomerase/epimerase family protein n=1 Tax=Bacillus sp. FJAT-28004 TaxID=1679165 RepID=UPI0006B4C792|nr:sugar phosphate isomerase/epimerase family protein [Bacillus sp. FJAT-28004]